MFKKNPVILLAFYLILSIIILSFNLNPTVKTLRDFLFYMVVTPYSKIDTAIVSFANLGSNINELVQAHQEVQKLKVKNQQLLHDLAKLKTLEIENRRLSELLGYKRKIYRPTVISRVITKPPHQYFNSIIIDKGSVDGLSENRAVYGFYKNRFGVVGQLLNVEQNLSQVLLITSRISKIPAHILPANVDGLVIGCETAELEMLWIPSDAEIKIGDEVVTSTASDIFPAGIPIGIITQVTQTGHLPFKKASVKPLIPATQLMDVFIE
ncbi:MAG: rod shape-determining protein MreC [Elusimicrobiota bacterium]